MDDYDIPQYVEDHRRPEEIEDDLERTRAEVSSTIDAIQSKLTPGQMMDQAFAYARTSLPAEFGTNLANTVRDNPVPVALMGVGIAWLMASGRRSSSRSSSYAQPRGRRQAYDDDYDHAYNEPYADSGGMQGDKLHGAMEAVSEKGSEWRAQAEKKGRNALDKASDLGHRIGDKASSVTERARSVGYQTRDRVSDISHRSQEQYYRAKDGVNRMVDEQPLMVGVLGLAAGALLGALLPSTRREDEMMGGVRDDLLDKAKEAASEQADRVKESAKHVAEVAKEEAKSVAAEVAPGVKTGDSRYAAGAGSTGRPAAAPRTDSTVATNSGLAPGRQASTT
ncbi:MAG TPA: DUF3618 domain-containing protein, partial [Oxalicibacterium sp.]|nr:DUF3618 domain-containing protein [Oxalicibacterium sp.]